MHDWAGQGQVHSDFLLSAQLQATGAERLPVGRVHDSE